MRVECRSDGQYAGEPLALWWQGERLEVRELLREWYSPEGKGFRVLAENELVFVLLYNEHQDDWTITLK